VLVEAEAIGVEAEAVDEITVSTFLEQRHSQGGGEGAQAPPSAIRILMFIFLVFHQHCKSRSGALQNVLWQYHKA